MMTHDSANRTAKHRVCQTFNLSDSLFPVQGFNQRSTVWWTYPPLQRHASLLKH